MCWLQLISRNVERSVKNPQDVDVSIVLDEVSYSEMSVQQDADISAR
jgi:hypothetical protein